MACTRRDICGDGKLALAAGEDCDDGNTAGGDGCSPLCKVESELRLPHPGHALHVHRRLRRRPC